MKFLQNARLRRRLRLLAAAAVFIIFVLLTIKLFPLVLALRNPEYQQAFEEKISSLGLVGVLVFLLIQVLQVVLAFIPGEPALGAGLPFAWPVSLWGSLWFFG
mgnify:CR=1 FL=1